MVKFLATLAVWQLVKAQSVSELVDEIVYDEVISAEDIIGVNESHSVEEISQIIDVDSFVVESTISGSYSLGDRPPNPMTDAIRQSYSPNLPSWVEEECCVCEDWSPSTPSTWSGPSTPSTLSVPSTPSMPSWSRPSNCCYCDGVRFPFTYWDYMQGGTGSTSSPLTIDEEKKEKLGLPEWVEKDCCFCKDYSPPSTPSSTESPSTPSTPSTFPSSPSWETPSACCRCGHEDAYDLPFGAGDYKLWGETESPSEIAYPKGLISQAGRIHNSVETCVSVGKNGKNDKNNKQSLTIGKCHKATEFEIYQENFIVAGRAKHTGASKCWAVENVSKTGAVTKPISKIGLAKCNGSFSQMFYHMNGQVRYFLDDRFCVAVDKKNLVLRACNGLKGDDSDDDKIFGLAEFL